MLTTLSIPRVLRQVCGSHYGSKLQDSPQVNVRFVALLRTLPAQQITWTVLIEWEIISCG